MSIRKAIVKEAREWIGTPFEHQHRAKGHATDCAGLVIGVARSCGLVAADFDVQGYARQPHGNEMLTMCDALMVRKELWSLIPGDVVVFTFNQEPQHVGIVADYKHGGLSVIHAYSEARGKGIDPRGQVVEHRLMKVSAMMKPVGAYQLPGVEETWPV